VVALKRERYPKLSVKRARYLFLKNGKDEYVYLSLAQMIVRKVGR